MQQSSHLKKEAKPSLHKCIPCILTRQYEKIIFTSNPILQAKFLCLRTRLCKNHFNHINYLNLVKTSTNKILFAFKLTQYFALWRYSISAKTTD